MASPRRAWSLLALAGLGTFLAAASLFALRPALLDAGDGILLGLGGVAGRGAATLLAWMGNAEVAFPLLLVGAFLLHRAGRTPVALVLLGAFFAQEVTVAALKAWVARPRPDFALVAATGGSFPSGHAARGALLACLLAAVALQQSTGWRRPLLAAAGAWALLMAAARVVLGVHHVSDVLAGLGVGLALGGLGVVLALAWEERRATVRVPVEGPLATADAEPPEARAPSLR